MSGYWHGYRSRHAARSGVVFPNLECWSPLTRSVTFAAEVDGRRVMCRIEADVLSEHTPVPSDKPLEALARSRTAVYEAARLLIEQGAYESDGSIVVRRQHL